MPCVKETLRQKPCHRIWEPQGNHCKDVRWSAVSDSLQMEQLPVTHSGAGASPAATTFCQRCWFQMLILPRVVDDRVSPAGSALTPTSPPVTVTLEAPPPASPGGRMACPAICFTSQSTRYGTMRICRVTRQSKVGNNSKLNTSVG